MSFKKVRPSVALFAILGMALFLRFFTLSKLMVFTPDEEYVLYITQTLVKHLHIIWIGVSALGFDFYMGPGLNYFLVPFMWAFKGNPLVWGVITSSFGVITAYLIYFLGNKMFGKRVGIIASLIYAFSALLIYYDQQPYPTGVPLLSILMLISIYNTKNSKKWWIVFSFLYGLVFHIHLSMVLVLFVAVYWAITHRKTWNFKIVLASFAAFILVISPLIGFDFLHNFSNITAPIRVFQAVKESKNKFDLGKKVNGVIAPISRIWFLGLGKSNTDEILYPCNSLPKNNSTKANLLVVLVLILLLIFYFTRKDVFKSEDKKLLFIFSLAYLTPFVFLSSIGSVEYYLLGFFPPLLLIIAIAIESLNKNLKNVCYVLLTIFAVYNFMVIFSASGEFGLSTKKKMISDVMSVVGASSFTLRESGGPCQGTAGWGYLFSFYGRKPDNNISDRQFSWLVPIGSASKTQYDVLINENRFPVNVNGYTYKFTEGGFTSYVTRN